MSSLEDPIGPLLDSPFAVACVTLVFLLLCFYFKTRPALLDPSTPGPKGKFYVGVFPEIDDNWERFPEWLMDQNTRFGRTWGGPLPNIGILGTAVYSLVGEAQVKHVLKDNFDNYEKGVNFKDKLEEFLGEGIFSTDGALWKTHRKVASHMFSVNLMRNGTQVLIKQVRLVDDLLASVATKDSVIDIQDIWFRMTLDVFASILFGVELDSVNADKQHPFALAFDSVQMAIQRRFRDPIWKVNRMLQLTREERIIRAGCKVMDEFADKVIKEKKRSSASSLGPDLLSRFLDVKKGEPQPSSKELRDIVMNFMLAGRDTTACALSWTMYELSKHPEVVEKLLKEFRDVVGQDTSVWDDADKAYALLGNLKYTNAVAMEALRLHPSVPVDHKYAKKADVLPDGTKVIAGACVFYSPYAISRDQKMWGSDAEEFKPERFMDITEPSAFKFTVFNAGYRMCLGKPLALLEIKLALCMLLPKYKFVDDGNHKGGYSTSLVMPMNPGLQMKVELR